MTKKYASKKKALMGEIMQAPKIEKKPSGAKKQKAYATPSATKKIDSEIKEDIVAITSELDFFYVHYIELNKKKYEIYVLPQIVKTFFENYKIDLEYDENLKVFKGIVSEIIDKGPITFVPFKNRPISIDIQQKAIKVRDDLEWLDKRMEALKEEHAALRQQGIELVLANGISTKKGRIYHKKMLTGNWITSVRQLLSNVEMRSPSISDVEDLIEKHPKHKKMLQRLINNSTKHFEIDGINEENILKVARALLKYKVKDIKISFKSSDDIDEDEFPNCFSWDDMDIDTDQVATMLNDLPFEVKLDLYDLPESDYSNIQFHYKTDQKTDPECPYCGDDFVNHTNKCGTCGLVANNKTKKK